MVETLYFGFGFCWVLAGLQLDMLCLSSSDVWGSYFKLGAWFRWLWLRIVQ